MPEAATSVSREPGLGSRIIKALPGVREIRDLIVEIESWWFDLRHHVNTSVTASEQGEKSWREDKVNFYYMPTRPKWVRRALRHLPAKEREEYTFVDFGSGKGRVLLMAAQSGFKSLYGIELRKELHEQACKNIRQFHGAEGCRIESILLNATDYEFPQGKLVLFFFNPFGSEVMEKVLGKLENSLRSDFRDVWVILHGSVCSAVADANLGLRLQVAHRGYRIYRSVPHPQ